MLLAAEDARLFHQLYPALLGFIAGRLGGIQGVHDLASFQACALEVKPEIRDQVYKNLPLLDAYVNENPDGWGAAELDLIAAWRLAVRGTFIALRDLKKFTLFLDEHDPPKVYGVLGLTTELADLFPLPMPIYLRAVLLPWKGQIVCDGLVIPYAGILGGGIKQGAEERYRQAKVEAGIMTSLEETESSELAPAVLRGTDRRTKMRISVLLDSDVVAYFEQEAGQSGKKPDTLINATLRRAILATVSSTDSADTRDELSVRPRRRKKSASATR